MSQKLLKLFSWNVNGIRACEKKGFLTWLNSCGADIVMLQETKASPDQLSASLCRPAGFYAEWCAAEKKGYSGVATYSRGEPQAVTRGLGGEHFDREGRVLISTIYGITIINTYFPSGSSGSDRVAYKLDFYKRFLDVLRGYIDAGVPVIVAGDVNTAYAEIDLARPSSNRKTSGFLPEERAALNEFFVAGLIDTFRHLRPAEVKYSWWDVVSGARARNVGWRLDYIFVSRNLLPYVVDADIHTDVLGSDHCPVSLTLALPERLFEKGWFGGT
jgi:exodeoxyribonuclease-3